MGLQIIKDGAIQGWFVSFSFTAITILLLALGFVSEGVAKAWTTFGDKYYTIYIGSLVAWFGYKVLQPRMIASRIRELIEQQTETKEVPPGVGEG